MIECEFCKCVFKNNSIYNYHKKNSKKCLEIQSNKFNINIESNIEECEFCNKTYSHNNMKNHKKNCKEKIRIDNEKKDIRIKELEASILQKEYENNQKKLQLEEKIIRLETELSIYKQEHKDGRNLIHELAKQPKKTNTNNTTNTTNTTNTVNNNNLSVFNSDVVKERFLTSMKDKSMEEFLDGQTSIGRIVAPCLINEDGSYMIICSDFSRGVFKFKNELGEIEKDINCKKLADAVQPLAYNKVTEMFNSELNKRSKIFSLRVIIDKIQYLEGDIQQSYNLLKGVSTETDHYKNTLSQIKGKEKILISLEEQKEQLRQEGIDENTVIDLNFDIKVTDSLTDIYEMNYDSTKFSKELGIHLTK